MFPQALRRLLCQGARRHDGDPDRQRIVDMTSPERALRVHGEAGRHTGDGGDRRGTKVVDVDDLWSRRRVIEQIAVFEPLDQRDWLQERRLGESGRQAGRVRLDDLNHSAARDEPLGGRAAHRTQAEQKDLSLSQPLRRRLESHDEPVSRRRHVVDASTSAQIERDEAHVISDEENLRAFLDRLP